MKKIILLLIIAIAFFQSKAQTYHKFLNHSSWYESVNPGFGLPITYYYYKQQNDTILGGVTYSKILITSGGSNYFVREDTLAKKVFMKPDASTAEFLLYDFSLNVGDSFVVHRGCRSGTLHVLNVDSVITPQGYRKSFTLNSVSGFSYFSYIEGIGCTADPFLNDYCGGDPDLRLICCYQGSTQLYDCNCAMGGNFQCYTYYNQPCDASFNYTYGPNGQVTFTNLYSRYSSHWYLDTYPYIDTLVYTPSLTYAFPCNGSFTVSCTVSMDDSNKSMCSYGPLLIDVSNSNNIIAGYTYTLGTSGQISFSNTSIGTTISNVVWYYTDLTTNTPYPNSTVPPDSLTPGDTYYVGIQVYNINFYGCRNTYWDTIRVPANTTGIKKETDYHLKISPNPCNNILTIKSEQEIGEVKILDLLGNTIDIPLTNTASENLIQADVTTLRNGVYFIYSKTREGTTTQKVIVQH